jgi:hypothetical protein
MRLIERLRVQREARELYQEARASGKSHDEAGEHVAAHLQEKYGASIDWAKIVEIILMILAMFQK